MLLVALTGGIGSGKSSASERLAGRGAAIIDADAVVKELQAPGQPVFAAMVQRWGDGIVGEDGRLDRQAVADIVFSDEDELKTLNGIVHPEVRNEMQRQVEELAPTDRVVVLDIPLLGKGDAAKRGARGVIVVDCPVETAIDRLVAHRGFDRADAEARMAAQVSREDRLTLADFVVDNSGDLEQLDAEIDRCWNWLADLAKWSAVQGPTRADTSD